jgi:hypothetical protein
LPARSLGRCEGVGDEVWAKRKYLTHIVDYVRELTKARGLKLAVRYANPAAIVAGGKFRADNVDGFGRLLEASFASA